MGKAHTSTGIQEPPIITHLMGGFESADDVWGDDHWLDDMDVKPLYGNYTG